MNISKNIFRLLLPVVAVFLASCKPMDNKFSDFVDDGPITYIAKLDIDQVRVIGEYHRVRFTWPAQSDPRGTKALITWASGTQKVEKAVDPSIPTEFVIDEQILIDEDGEETTEPLPESTHIFEITLYDDEGNSSLPISVTGTVYGELWGAYQTLRARNLVSSVMEADGSREITFMKNSSTQDSNPILGDTFIEWQSNSDTAPQEYILPESETVAAIDEFGALSFRYRSAYVPELGSIVDPPFLSGWQYYCGNVTEETVDSAFQFEELIDNDVKKFIFPVMNDAHFAGYEFRWINDGETVTKTQRTSTNEITLENCNSLRVNIRTLFKYDDVEVSSSQEVIYDMMTLIDENYSRTAWTVTTTTHNGYLYAPDGTVGTAAYTGNPMHLLDGLQSTYLGLVKPGGSLAGLLADGTTTATQTPPLGSVPYFTVDMQEVKEVNKFFWRHRQGGPSANNYGYLRVYGVRLEGSVDGEEFETILPKESLPAGVTVTETIHTSDTYQTPNAHEIFWIPSSVAYNSTGTLVDSNTYELYMKEVKEYRYIRVYLTVQSKNYGSGTTTASYRARYERSDYPMPTTTGSGNSMQVSEFGLGVRYYTQK